MKEYFDKDRKIDRCLCVRLPPLKGVRGMFYGAHKIFSIILVLCIA
jgi:hypothetical protein